MRPALAAAGGFLAAVLWFDLMFDVQALRRAHRGGPLPEPVLASIAGYYRRVTTEASPMGRLVAGVMLAALGAAAWDLATGARPLAVRALSLALLTAPIALAGARTVPNAVRLGARADPPERQSALARAIARDHIACLAAVTAFLLLQLAAP
ncbi:MAG TPA: hypothetical protein VLC53_13380 [Myxococcota bacterium]|nr:hypothetical protein [Myxococcota bacterium]